MTAPVVRRLRLPPAQSSPAVARAAVYEAVLEADLTAVLDEAMLLTTELVTNGVVHARTELEIEIIASADAISVMVLDRRCGPLALTGWDATTPGPTPEATERGRGLLLVDRLADRWGTLHHREGKGVWFWLRRQTGGSRWQRKPGLATAPGAVAPPETLMALTALGTLMPLLDPATDHATLLLENHRLRQADIQRRAWLMFLAEAGELLAQSLDVELTIALVPRLVVPRLGRWCAVHILGPDDELTMAAATHADESRISELMETLANATRQLRDVLRADGAVALPTPVDGYAVPLVARGQRLGTLTVGRGGATWPGAEEIAVAEDVARRSALAIDNARIYADRRGVARELQRSLLPPRLPKVVGVEFGAEYVSTGDGADVGGDFYDVMSMSDDQWLVVVGDVSGKGVQVATVTGLVREVTRALVRDGRPLADTLSRLNETLVERGGGRFCTLALATITRDGGPELHVHLHLAGHDQPILVRADGSATLVGQCGTALGLFDAVRSPQRGSRYGGAKPWCSTQMA